MEVAVVPPLSFDLKGHYKIQCHTAFSLRNVVNTRCHAMVPPSHFDLRRSLSNSYTSSIEPNVSG